MKQAVNERVKALRVHLNLSQDDLAHGIGTTITSISRIENGFTVPRASTLQKMIDVYSVNKDWLINGIGEMSFNTKEAQQSPIVWKDEAYEAVKRENGTLKQEVDRLWQLVMNFSQKGANPNFLKPTDVAEFPFNLLKGDYSGAFAQA